MRNVKGTLPNILTMVNLSLGVFAILLAVSSTEYALGSSKHAVDRLFYASLMVMIAALTDRFDGKVARMLDATSELGKELDSLSDLISFGVAPVIIAWKISFIHLGIWGYLLAVIFPIAGAYRLARYNTTDFNNVFMGVPITIAGAFLTIDNLYNTFVLTKHPNSANPLSPIHIAITAVLVIMLSYLMISKIKIRKL